MDLGKRKQLEKLGSSPEPCSSSSSSKKAKEELSSEIGSVEVPEGAPRPSVNNDERANPGQSEEELAELQRKGEAMRAVVFALFENSVNAQLTDDDCITLYTSIADLYTNPYFESSSITQENVAEQEKAIILQLEADYDNLWLSDPEAFAQESTIAISKQFYAGLTLYRINIFPIFLAIDPDDFNRVHGLKALLRKEREFCAVWRDFHLKKAIDAFREECDSQKLGLSVPDAVGNGFSENYWIREQWVSKYNKVCYGDLNGDRDEYSLQD